ncbi:NUDIX hydrolase [Roseivirga pacifica]|uniref:NUDIX hydrolase n=1 Tax=Roseivirga pacifica TaxID=1267423 RepID=UPI0020947824|nr:NUDIX domain-containing protein [Roseivirga pacifica]MCO6358235.1 NUDIX domain-containing protein [Roseivirga pacifica]MCO6366301.1 NUDIX domain-containing protein [Roseivirga pacifica]MCO6369148.1 NUDIX domain-containing protein [Roseivirga pacifica]MCO6373966.1 NUDIX domain-containing protein [Roseivirga pacifica]MCO6378342.1 NUDIX domain-containing protein [Roseivirga pacifica]
MIKQSIKLTVDAVVFGYESDSKISVLLVKRRIAPYKGEWAIPGGFVKTSESLEEAVQRELKEETGVSISYLEQLYTFGESDRDPRERVVSVAYYGLIKPQDFDLNASTDAEEAEWFDIDELPELAFDHKRIIEVAIDRLKGKVTYEPIGFELLDREFPFSDLENLYVTLLGRPIDRRNFRKKMLSFGLLDELDKKSSTGRGRPANLFRFNSERYFSLKKEGFVFEI